MTTLISYLGDIAGFAGGDRFYPAPHIAALPSDHPIKRFVTFMWVYDRELRAGRLSGEYSDDNAELFARFALIDDEFVRVASVGVDDAELAEVFEVPIEQIAAKRRDLLSLRLATLRTGRS